MMAFTVVGDDLANLAESCSGKKSGAWKRRPDGDEPSVHHFQHLDSDVVSRLVHLFKLDLVC